MKQFDFSLLKIKKKHETATKKNSNGMFNIKFAVFVSESNYKCTDTFGDSSDSNAVYWICVHWIVFLLFLSSTCVYVDLML